MGPRTNVPGKSRCDYPLSAMGELSGALWRPGRCNSLSGCFIVFEIRHQRLRAHFGPRGKRREELEGDPGACARDSAGTSGLPVSPAWPGATPRACRLSSPRQPGCSSHWGAGSGAPGELQPEAASQHPLQGSPWAGAFCTAGPTSLRRVQPLFLSAPLRQRRF